VLDKRDAADLVPVLLKHGANPNARLKRPIIGRHHDAGDATLGEGTTPLMRAAKTVDLRVMKLLLEGGADATITQRDYSTAAMIVAAGGRGGSVPEATVIEALKLCFDHGIDVDAFNGNGQTVLHAAVQRGANGIIRFLAERGAKLDMKNRQGRTPLDLATGAGAAAGGGRGAGGPRGGAAPAGGPAREETANLLRELIAARGGK
jgi:ankyrin repeat protein